MLIERQVHVGDIFATNPILGYITQFLFRIRVQNIRYTSCISWLFIIMQIDLDWLSDKQFKDAMSVYW